VQRLKGVSVSRLKVPGTACKQKPGAMAAKAANALYDPQFGWNPPARYQQERAWCEVVRKEKRIQV